MVELSNFELMEAGRKYNIPLRTVYSKNMLPIQNRIEANSLPNGGYIVNLQDSHDSSGAQLGGTHWVAFFIVGTPMKRKMVYFDSYGSPPPLEVQKLAKLLGALPMKYNTSQIQSMNSGVCGYYCLSFIWEMKNATIRSIDSLLNKYINNYNLKNPEKNREILARLLNRIKID